MKQIIWGLSVLWLSGCATMSIEECQTANWQRIGEQDGVRGQGSVLAQHYKACQKGNIVPNQAQYEAGYQRGLAQYCQVEQVFHAALEGRGNYQHCPIARHSQLRPFYQTADRYYQSKKQLDALEQRLLDVRDYLRNPKLSDKDRRYYQREYDRVRADLPAAHRDYYEAEQTLRDFKYRHNLY